MKRRISILLALMMCIFSSLTVYAYEYKTEVESEIPMGYVSIDIVRKSLDDDGDEISWKNPKNVLPGEPVPSIVRFKNKAENVWIRAKVEYTSDDGLDFLNDKMLGISDSNWKKIDEYFYYTKPVEKETIDFIDTIIVPYEWDSDYAEKKFSVIITAEAVQEANFTPNFDDSDPWFGTLIESTIHTVYEPVEKTTHNFEIIYQGTTHSFFKNEDNFFSNFGPIMPGDNITDSVVVGNKYKSPIRIYFQTERLEQLSEIEEELLSLINLTIYNEDELIYDGPLSADELNDKISLGIYHKDVEKELKFTLSVPEDLTNKYSLSNTKIKWIFSTEVNPGSTNSGGGGDNQTKPNNKPNQNESGPGVEPDTTPEQKPIENEEIKKEKPIIDKVTETIDKAKENLETLAEEAIPDTGDKVAQILEIAIIIDILLIAIIIFVNLKAYIYDKKKK